MSTNRTFVFALTLGCYIACFADKFDDEGGLVKLGGKGELVIFDCRQVPHKADYEKGLAYLSLKFPVATRIVNGIDFSLTSAAESVGRENAKAAVFIVENEALPISLLASEERWACVNMKQLSADKPISETLKSRLSKMLVRQCYRLLGSDATKSPETSLYPIFSVQDIDAIQCFDLSAWAQMSISDAMPRIGFEPEEFYTYRDACEAGLAPPPTNDIQKAIWEKVQNKKADKADPTNRWKRDFPDKEKNNAK